WPRDRGADGAAVAARSLARRCQVAVGIERDGADADAADGPADSDAGIVDCAAGGDDRRARAAHQRGSAGGQRGADSAGGGACRGQGARPGRVVGPGGAADARREGANGHSNTAAAASTQVITPRRTRLVRVAELHAFRHVVAALVDTRNPEREPGTRNQEPGTPSPEPRT